MALFPNNTRYILELERETLLREKYEFEEKYGTFSIAFLTSLETFALLTCFYIAGILVYYKEVRTKTNFIVVIWALLNSFVLFERIFGRFGHVLKINFSADEDPRYVAQMIAALGRVYGTSLSVVWFFSKYFGSPKPKYDYLAYFLIALPTVIFTCFLYYYVCVNKFIYEAFGPSCDIGNVIIYASVGLLFILCKIFVSSYDISNYALYISLVNLVTNFPLSLITIYLRFNLDVSWYYRYEVYFVEFLVNAVNCSSAFFILLIIFVYNKNVRSCWVSKQKMVDSESDSNSQKLHGCKVLLD